MKRKGMIPLMLMCTLTLTSCTPIKDVWHNFTNWVSGIFNKDKDTGAVIDDERTGKSVLRIVSCNDFHGVIDQNGNYPGLEAFGAKIKKYYDEKPEDTLILSAGDMFQGSGVSSVTKGKIVVDAMNYLKFDAMALGNHEFDWGLDTLRKHHDTVEEDYDNTLKEVNPEANFPYLGCNIYYNNGKGEPENHTFASDICSKYTIVERANMKIGLIGYIGSSQLSSICATIGSQLAFHDPVTEVSALAKKLREEEKCDFIIAIGHDANDNNNDKIARLSGSSKVNYILNGHSHEYYVKQFAGTYTVQSGSNGMDIGYAEFTCDFDKNRVTCSKIPTNTYQSSYSSLTNTKLAENTTKHKNLTAPVFNEVLGHIGSSNITSSSRNALGLWVSDCVRQQVGADYGFTNYGGVRTSGFPLAANSNVTLETFINIMPFDNCIVVAKMYGYKIKEFYSDYYAHSFNFSESTYKSSLEDSHLYTCAFDEFSYGKIASYCNSSAFSEYLVRDAMVNEMRYQTSLGINWDFYRTAQFSL